MNNYAEMFRFEMQASMTYAPENSGLHQIVQRWEKEYPDDSNLFFAKAILASDNPSLSKDEILTLIKKGENGKMYDSINYSWFFDTAIACYRQR